jgi:hypothetical protein
MERIYLTQEAFESSRYHVVKSYPNPNIKAVLMNGKKFMVNIITPDQKVTVSNLTKQEQEWYGARNHDVVMVTVENGYFPTELLAGVIDGRYSENHYISRRYGWINSMSTGTGSGLILKSKIDDCVQFLKSVGYEVEYAQTF